MGKGWGGHSLFKHQPFCSLALLAALQPSLHLVLHGRPDGSSLGDLADSSCFPSSILSAVVVRSKPLPQRSCRVEWTGLWLWRPLEPGVFTVGHMRFLLRLQARVWAGWKMVSKSWEQGHMRCVHGAPSFWLVQEVLRNGSALVHLEPSKGRVKHRTQERGLCKLCVRQLQTD